MSQLQHLAITWQLWLSRTRDERGASMVEYGLLVGLIAVFAILAVKFFGGQVSSSFSNSANNLP
jgi:Flp pilus assembly pilin Flp